MLPDTKNRKIESTTSNYMFIGYANNSAAYRFLVLNSDVLELDTIVETKNTEFLENIFSLKHDNISHVHAFKKKVFLDFKMF